MATGKGDSYIVYCDPTPGTTLWPFAFRDGYIDRLYVKARYRDWAGKWWPVTFNPRTALTDPNVLEITPAIPPCRAVEIYRDTPKDGPIVVYPTGGTFSNESRSAAVRQSLHVLVELKESRDRYGALTCACGCTDCD